MADRHDKPRPSALFLPGILARAPKIFLFAAAVP
jgi:hypothetical protein